MFKLTIIVIPHNLIKLKIKHRDADVLTIKCYESLIQKLLLLLLPLSKRFRFRLNIFLKNIAVVCFTLHVNEWNHFLDTSTFCGSCEIKHFYNNS